MNITELLVMIREEFETAGNMPMSNKCVIDRDKCIDLVNDVLDNLPQELLDAGEVIREKDIVIKDAEQEALSIIDDAANRVEELVDQDEITKLAYEKSEQLLKTAQHQAEEIRQSANEYVEDILADLENYIQRNLDIVRQNRSQMRGN